MASPSSPSDNLLALSELPFSELSPASSSSSSVSSSVNHLLAFSGLFPASFLQLSPAYFSSSPASPSSSSTLTSADADDPVNLILEDICREEFGFELGELKQTLCLQAEKLQSSLLRFSDEVIISHDPAQRREFAKTFITGIAKIAELFTERSNRMLFQMQSTFLENMKRESDMLRKELAQVQEKLTVSELDKGVIEAKANMRFEEVKTLLQEELQACRICLRNARNVVIIPCLHAQYCEGCVERHQKNHKTCPTCRGIIRGKLPYIA